jgi:hypothetical protein
MAAAGITGFVRIVSPITLMLIPHLQRQVETVVISGMAGDYTATGSGGTLPESSPQLAQDPARPPSA